MNITVYGLGIIGASLAAALRRAGHFVCGKNRSAAPVAYALEHGYIDCEARSFEGADVVFLAVPPKECMRVLAEENFPAGCIVSDICGVKAPLEELVYSAPRGYRYVGIHPMAGKETSGIASAEAGLFDGKNLVMVRAAGTDEAAFSAVEKLGEDAGFSRIVVCSAAEHDKMIALTSQLAHVVSNAYVKSPLTAECLGFTGGSFQDMTRIAGVDEKVWTELFFYNKEYLAGEIARLESKLLEYRAALEEDDPEKMRALLAEGKSAFAAFVKKLG